MCECVCGCRHLLVNKRPDKKPLFHSFPIPLTHSHLQGLRGTWREVEKAGIFPLAESACSAAAGGGDMRLCAWCVIVATALVGVGVGVSGDCTKVGWRDVCEHDKRRCVVVSSFCPPQNSLIETVKAGTVSRVGDGGYTVEVWPYDGCVAADNLQGCLAKARAVLAEQLVAANGSADYEYPEINVWEEWTVTEIRASNLVIQGFNGSHPFFVRFTDQIAEQNGVLGIQGVLCRVFWLTGKNVTIRNARINTEECCQFYINNQTSAAECTPIVCTAPDCSYLRVEDTRMTGIAAAVRIQRDDRGLTTAHNVSLSFGPLLHIAADSTPVALVAIDVEGSFDVHSSEVASVLLKTGTFDTTIYTGHTVTVLNISDYVSPLKALFIDEEPLTYTHESPKNVYETIIYMSAILLGGILLLVVMAVVVNAIKKDVKDEGEKAKGD